MRLGYFCYSWGSARLARIALYCDEPNVDVFTENLPFRLFSSKISVSPVLLQGSFSLEARRDNGTVIGTCQGDFIEGSLLLTERRGIFAGVRAYEITERETLRAMPFTDESAGISLTDMVLLSRKWEGYQLIVGERGVESWDVQWWDDHEIKEKTWSGRRRVTGHTMRYGGSAGECSAALVALTSGPHTGKAGWLLWGDDAGVAISGALGDVTGAVWLPNLESFPGKCQDKIKLPPVSVAGDLRKATQGTDGIAMY